MPDQDAVPDRPDRGARGLLSFIDASPSPYHAVRSAAARLADDGFVVLDETEAWPSGAGRYSVIRGGSLVAWEAKAGGDPLRGFRLIGAHTDSPNLRLKPRPDTGGSGCRQLGIEVYGGVLLNSWLDRDLGLSGRVSLRDGRRSVTREFRVDRPLLRVPQLAIHLDRGVNDGLKLNPQQHLVPVWALGPPDEGGFRRFLAKELGVTEDAVLTWDAMLHDLTPSSLLGVDDEFVSAPRIDNLASCHTAVEALSAQLDSSDWDGEQPGVAAICLYDHEEIGSQSATGADGSLLVTVLERIALAGGLDRDGFHRALASSMCVSADGAHATHPNYPERHDPEHPIRIGGGPVLKVNANVRYATDAKSAAVFELACDAAGVPLQRFVSRGDMPCGSTIGPVTAARLGVSTVDVGIPQLSMHSAREMCGAHDPAMFIAALSAFLVAFMTAHPLEPLSGDEITRTADIYRRSTGEDHPLFSMITLEEPTRHELDAFAAGAPVDRRARAVAISGPCSLRHSIISLDRDEVVSEQLYENARPALLFDEVIRAAIAVYEDPRWQQAIKARGIDDLDRVQIDPWPPGTFGLEHEEGRRLTRVICYLREDAEDNGYARPIEGVIADVDLATGEVVDFQDRGIVPLPPERASYYPEDNGPLRDDLKPIEITQPEGPSFTVEGNFVQWQRWQFRVSLTPIEGLVLHEIAYDDPAAGRVRPILRRAALSEMVVPYASTDPAHRWKNAFDAGEWGMGRFVNSLDLGCDCLGEIHYFDVVRSTEHGDADLVNNAICMHEEDYSLLWKHQDLHSFRTEVRRQRRLVVSAIYTVGNYEYGFYWYFYLDGTIQLEVKLTGIVQTQAVAPGDEPSNANMLAPGLAAPHHQHLFCVRLDPAIDGADNTVVEVDVETMPPGPDNEWANGFQSVAHPLTSEREARRDIDPTRDRSWRIVNGSSTNRLGNPVSYKLLPAATPTLHAHETSAVSRRAAFGRHNLWVTPYEPGERRAAGEHPNQSNGEDGLAVWTEQDRPIDDTEIVVWHTFGVTHLVRPEDWPVMPVESTGFSLIPVGFFDRNPALDVPPPSSHCG